MEIELRASCLGSGSCITWLVFSVHDLIQMETIGISLPPTWATGNAEWGTCARVIFLSMCVICINPDGERMSTREWYSPVGPGSLIRELLLDSADSCFTRTELFLLKKKANKCVFVSIYIFIYNWSPLKCMYVLENDYFKWWLRTKDKTKEWWVWWENICSSLTVVFSFISFNSSKHAYFFYNINC